MNEDNNKFLEYANVIGAEINTVDGIYTVAHKPATKSKDIIILMPGGAGSCCFSEETITVDNVIMPANLPVLFFEKGISSCIFNFRNEIPARYSPLLPLFDDDPDDVNTKSVYQQIKSIVFYYSKIYDRIWVMGHSSSATVAVGTMQWWPDFENHISGLILVAPKKIFKRPNKNYIPHFGKSLSIPVLAFNHELDGSMNCPMEFNRMLSKCSLDRRSRHVLMSGGVSDGIHDPSLGFGYHGLRGLENKVVSEIVGMIKTSVDQ